jgi:hypothetical protein
VTRWPERETLSDRTQGVQLATIQELARNWRHDSRRFERKPNAFPPFVTEIDGIDIRFNTSAPSTRTHYRSSSRTAGRGGVMEMINIIGPAHRPIAYGGSAEDAFDVVVQPMPGYGCRPGRQTRAGARCTS